MRWAWPLLALSLLAAGCDSPPLPVSCGALPDRTACPVTGPDTCSDPSCSALYSCNDEGTWVFQASCEGYEGQGGQAGGGGSGGQVPCDLGPIHSDLSCPSLQGGDCDAALINNCAVDLCLSGCEGFLRCENGTWSEQYVAYCTEDGELITD